MLDLASPYLRLAEDGDELETYIGYPLCRGTLAGLVNQVADWQTELQWLRAAGRDGGILSENVGAGRGELEDRLRNDGINVIGSSTYGARLEIDRAYAQRIFVSLGDRLPPFSNSCKLQRRAASSTNVLRATLSNRTGQMPRPLLAAIALLSMSRDSRVRPTIRRIKPNLDGIIDGIEMGVGAYSMAKFPRAGLPRLGAQGVFPVTLVNYRRDGDRCHRFSQQEVFDLTLAKMLALLKENGYRGYINLNTMVNESGIWPLEFACRFGHPEYAILDPLQRSSWPDLFRLMLERNALRFATEPGSSEALLLPRRHPLIVESR